MINLVLCESGFSLEFQSVFILKEQTSHLYNNNGISVVLRRRRKTYRKDDEEM